MTELELFDRLNPKRDLPQATCDVISQVYKAMQKDNTEKDKQIAELEAQIEKMKCCGNCAKYNSDYRENPCKLFSSGICGEWETSVGKW